MERELEATLTRGRRTAVGDDKPGSSSGGGLQCR